MTGRDLRGEWTWRGFRGGWTRRGLHGWVYGEVPPGMGWGVEEWTVKDLHGGVRTSGWGGASGGRWGWTGRDLLGDGAGRVDGEEFPEDVEELPPSLKRLLQHERSSQH